MPLDPFLEPIVGSLPPFPDHVENWDEFRAQEEAAADAMVDHLAEPGPEVAEVRAERIDVDGGAVDLLIYRPIGDGPHPVHLYLHGGGWVGGSIHQRWTDITCRERAAGANCLVVAVNYRKAPEYKFPTGLEDCLAALHWVVEHAEALDVRLDRLTVGGGSAGANLAAAVSLKVRDEGGPAIAFQLLEIPALDLVGGSPSRQAYGNGYGLSTDGMATLADLYLRTPEDATNPYASPLRAKNLENLPPAHIMVAEFDPLRDDGEAYAKRLGDAGVPVTFTLGAGLIHASQAFTKVMSSARAWRDEVVAVLKNINERDLPSAR